MTRLINTLSCQSCADTGDKCYTAHSIPNNCIGTALTGIDHGGLHVKVNTASHRSFTSIYDIPGQVSPVTPLYQYYQREQCDIAIKGGLYSPQNVVME